MTPPSCPIHGEMELCKLTQGEGKDDLVLGYIWACKIQDCDECEDAEEPHDSDHTLPTGEAKAET